MYEKHHATLSVGPSQASASGSQMVEPWSSTCKKLHLLRDLEEPPCIQEHMSCGNPVLYVYRKFNISWLDAGSLSGS